MYVLLSGTVGAFRRDPLGRRVQIAQRGPGHMLAELGHLWGHRAPFEGVAQGEVEALLVPPDGLRTLMVTEVELGTRLLEVLMLRRKALASLGLTGPTLVAPRNNPRLHRLQEFLLRSGYPHSVLDPASDPDAATLVDRHAAGPDDLPLAVCPDGTVLKNPGDIALGRYLDVLPNSVRRAWIRRGGGRGGAARDCPPRCTRPPRVCRSWSSIPGASEVRPESARGSRTTSAFPIGLSGQELTSLGFTQATKFGTEFAIPAQAVRLDCHPKDGPPGSFVLELDDGRHVSARTVVLASGARYRRPDLPGLESFEGRGIPTGPHR